MRKFGVGLFLAVAAAVSMAQTPPRAVLAYVNPGTGATMLTGALGASAVTHPPPAVLLYVSDGAGHYGPWTGASGGAPPTGPCGGDTGGTYPNCTVVKSSNSTFTTAGLVGLGGTTAASTRVNIPTGAVTGAGLGTGISVAVPTGAAANYAALFGGIRIASSGNTELIDTNSGSPLSLGDSVQPSLSNVYSNGDASRRWASTASSIYSIGTASNTDSAQQLTIPATTGTATYTTTGSYLNHPVCSHEVLATTAVLTTVGTIGANWVGANGGTNTTANSPTGTWTLTLTPATNPVADTPIDLTCFLRT